MRYCNNCGERIPDDAKFCPSCGIKFENSTKDSINQPSVDEPTPQGAKQEKTEMKNTPIDYSNTYYVPYNPSVFQASFQPPVERASGKLNVGMLVWSIINLLTCCTPLGIVGLIFTILANSAQTAVEEKSKIKTALILNIVGTVLAVLIIVFYIVIFVIMGINGVFDTVESEFYY